MLPSVNAKQIILPASFDGIYCLFASIDGLLHTDEAISPEEKSLADTMSEFRKKEFLAGRRLSRLILNKLNIPHSSILHDEHGCSLFPDGSIGSISHSRGSIAVAIASSDTYKAIGIDIEQTDRIKDNVFQRISTEKEKRSISSMPAEKQMFYKTQIFSAKESFYKMQFPITKHFLNWTDISVTPENGGSIDIQYEKNIPEEITSKPLLAHYSKLNTIVFTLCAQKQ